MNNNELMSTSIYVYIYVKEEKSVLELYVGGEMKGFT